MRTGNDKLGATESRRFGFQAALNVGIFGGSLVFGTTSRVSLGIHAYGFGFEVLAAKASFVYGGSMKFDLSSVTDVGASIVNSASTWGMLLKEYCVCVTTLYGFFDWREIVTARAQAMWCDASCAPAT
jgi:hypothetical protein